MDWIPNLLGWAVLLPLISFTVIFIAGPKLGPHGKAAGSIAIAAIFGSLCLSLIALTIWLGNVPPSPPAHHEDGDAAGHASTDHATEHTASVTGAHAETPTPISGDWYTLANFGQLKLSIGYYVDALTIAMFCMVSLIALCIHVYATGYMHDELHDVEDHEVHLQHGRHLVRPGRYHRFFQSMSLFCFSMLGLVVAGNALMTFVFWELVGICSYFLIGFYVERQSASNAANKAFIVNRVGDFGMIIGLMALWGSLGTFAYGDIDGQPGIFSLIRPAENHHAITVPDSMAAIAAAQAPKSEAGAADPTSPIGYGLLVVAGIGIFCGCVGKSAQFPLHVWLPDAMEGPTPVSALVHSATMVAAGVFLVARFYPAFTPEVLLVISCVGAITLFLAASIAITATDIKRVLAYSTVSQLGYMMLSLGVGGWLPGVLHLFTHAFFKSLLFLCSGSVIHAVHTNEMPQMGGLRRKMPWTAATMLIGCLAIAGAGIPFVVGLSGYYSKDAILEQAHSFAKSNPGFGNLFFFTALGGAAMTAFYMFRLWFLTFAGEARDHERYHHAHESPASMVGPLVVLATFAIAVAWGPTEAIIGSATAAVLFLLIYAFPGGRRAPLLTIQIALATCGAVFVLGFFWQASGYGHITLASLLEQARPPGTIEIGTGPWTALVWPHEHASHAAEIRTWVTILAFLTAVGGIVLAAIFYGWRILNPNDVRRQFSAIYQLLLNKWWFDELYDWLFVKPVLLVSQLAATFDRRWIDGFIDGLAYVVRVFSSIWDYVADRTLVDGFVNKLAQFTYDAGLALRKLQTGSLRQYAMFLVIGTLAIFVIVSFFWGYSFAA